MKHKYSSPMLTVHGNVKTLTQAVGSEPSPDGVIVNDQPLRGIQTDGSSDLIITT